ncbi:sigma factor-like helix-turn-helix DNA-binding protein [Megasphaera sp. SW808]|uniref:sigma factor-like helix-turn-helix DNA-binding protein n=1 Tax=Megasphaera sp. SW808 TaxID=2530045 RepID=UPI001F0DCBCD|nr:sigma factor-like helix-turn-helix DNA-binding protein [Megasphaera sp. SW808]
MLRFAGRGPFDGHLAVLECIYSFDLDGKDEGPAALRRAVQTAFRRESRHFKAYWQAVERMLFPQEERAEFALFRHSVCAFDTAVQRIEQCLTEEERHFLYLRYVKDYTYETIGALHGLSKPQACNIVGQAVDKLKAKVRADCLWPAVQQPGGRRNRIH